MPHAGVCRLVVRHQEGLAEVIRFVTEGLEIGQQVVAMAGPGCLKHLARALTESGLRPDSLLHNHRLVFLTVPDCVGQLSRLEDPLQRAPLRRNGPMLRWVSDWSWAYSNGRDPAAILEYQHRLHDFLRSFDALSLCTVHCQKLERASLLAVLADHRRAAKTRLPV
ncbi:MAG TPA: MEDS domain-containing protein [Terriglobia bacterium]|nr:MEDS domain-containing protein [Terriglobia bacterium]